ncbi:MAG TPA: PAS domain S-box protein [Bacteroidota bacterium]|nr:PAS domain S-box protein [Bacteroidota bacterium]
MSSVELEYERVFDALPEMILVVDREDRVVAQNRQASDRLFGARKSSSIETIFAPDRRDEMLRRLHESFEGLSIETQVVDRAGVTVDVHVDAKHVRAGRRTLTVVIARDITEQKRKELDLLRYSNVIHYTINPIQITDAQGKMVYVNPAFERESGYSKDELIGQNPRVFGSGKHDRAFWKGVWEHILSGKVWVGQVENRRKDGTAFHTELVISPIIDQKGGIAGFLGAHRDITEQKMLQEQLVRSQRMESIGTLAAGIAHEVGNPLTAISSLVQVLQRTSSDRFITEKLELIDSQISRIARIIRELVDFSRPSSHVVKDVSLNHVIREALSIIQYGKRVKDIKFSVLYADDLPTIRAVSDQLVQVFINVLINAVDALEGKSGSIAIETLHTAHAVGATVRDTGKGIAKAELERIFEPFYTTKAVGQGTGLGLWVSYGIVKGFGGNIEVESAPGEGSTFHITFPTTKN